MIYTVFLIGSVVLWRRSGSPVSVLVVIGALICSLNEPIVDVLGHCWFPKDGTILFTYLDRPIPVWVTLAYGCYFGGLITLTLLILERGASRRSMWATIGLLWVMNCILEFPLLAKGLYVYYGGDQPVQVGGFPLMWLVINCMGALLAAAVLHRFRAFFTGPRQALVLLVPFTAYFVSHVVEFPYFAVLNTDASAAVKLVSAIATGLIGLWVIDGLIRISIGLRADSTPELGTAPVPFPGRVGTPA
jgi:hypothetical protein